MASDSSKKPIKAGLSLYADLLDSSTKGGGPSTISRAPVVFKQPAGESSRQDEAAAQKQQLSAASLRFQPTKRPQITSQKPKTKVSGVKSTSPAVIAPTQPIVTPDTSSTLSRPPPKTSIADWTGDGDDDDVNGFYGGEKRQRGGRKKRKKGNKEDSHIVQNWDDIYDPSRPNNYEEYQNSDEKIREVREWKDRLYAHRTIRRSSDISESEDEGRLLPQMSSQFAPPSMSFAPPPDLNGNAAINNPRAQIPDDTTGEDAYARRLRLSHTQASHQPSAAPVAHSFDPPPPPPPPPPMIESPRDIQMPPPPPPPYGHVQPAASISRAPVRYNLPPPPAEIPRSEAELETALQQDAEDQEDEAESDAPRSLRPGQRGFAERLMSKYGWTKGSGLGASGSGIVNALRVQVEKQKKKPDSEGGGFVGPGGRGKIIGGKKKGGNDGEAEGGKFGAMSEVVVLRGMVDGMDLDAELDDGGLMQEIGEECGDKYGRVERVFIDRSNPTSAPVFVKFTSQLSALRAVNALEGRIFNGNTITARFFDTDKFEKAIYA
ncbi:hypothetical protein MMC13_005323 [Lambiella insularis]|nr:hypothetical protein [Lambiella insularis]